MPALAQPLRGQRVLGPSAGTAAAAAAALVPLLTAVGTVAARADPEPGTAAERGLPAVVLLLCLSGLGAGPAAAWAVREEHPGAAVGLAVATAAVAFPVWAGWPWLPAAVRSAALAATPFAVAGVAQVALRWRTSGGGAALRITWVAATGAATLHLLGYDPFADPECARTCAAVPPVLDGMLSTRATVTASAALVVLASVVAATAVRMQPGAAPLLLRSGVVLSLAALGGIAGARAAGWGGTTSAGLAIVLAPLTVAVVAAAVGAGVARTARTRTAVDALLSQLADPRDVPGTGQRRLRDVHFALTEEHRWVDRAGAEVQAPAPGDRTLVLSDPAGPAVRLLLPPGTDPGEVVAGLTSARRLMLVNARLTAEARARLGELQASQRRAVATRDAERTRIERDVHDGAQQRLVSAMFHLSLAQAHATPERSALLGRARDEVQSALTRLRRTARGPFPDVLAGEGLGAAVEELALDADVPVRVEAHGDLRVGADVARAAYAVVAAALGEPADHAPDAAALVALTREDGLLRIRVRTGPVPDAGPDTTDVADRVGALGGTYARERQSGCTAVTAVIPCG